MECPGICEGYELTQYDEYDSVLSYDEDGFWKKRILVQIPLDDIQFSAWKETRTQLNMKLITETGTVKPVELSKKRSKETGKLALVDGNHRCHACSSLGYKFIWAVQDQEMTTPPFPKEVMTSQRCKDYGYRFYHEIRLGIGFAVRLLFARVSHLEDHYTVELCLNGKTENDNVHVEIQMEASNELRPTPKLFQCKLQTAEGKLLDISGLKEEFPTSLITEWTKYTQDLVVDNL